MLNELKKEANKTLTENLTTTYATSGSDCLDILATQAPGTVRRNIPLIAKAFGLSEAA
jgi:hypothetical protein